MNGDITELPGIPESLTDEFKALSQFPSNKGVSVYLYFTNVLPNEEDRFWNLMGLV